MGCQWSNRRPVDTRNQWGHRKPIDPPQGDGCRLAVASDGAIIPFESTEFPRIPSRDPIERIRLAFPEGKMAWVFLRNLPKRK